MEINEVRSDLGGMHLVERAARYGVAVYETQTTTSHNIQSVLSSLKGMSTSTYTSQTCLEISN